MLDADSRKWVVIDEVQKVPKILDIVHQQIFDKKHFFALTGSSARKLKRGAANLLAGRAFVFSLFPLTHIEIGETFNLNSALQFGTLPEIFNLSQDIDKSRFLKSYALTYIKEEIVAEQVVRNLPPFRRFLEVAAQGDTDVINYSNVAKDVMSDPKTIASYYEILEDTLTAVILPSFHHSIRKRQKHAPKCYFFDSGVVRALAGLIDNDIAPSSFEYGQRFESFIVNEIHRLLTYTEKQFQLSYIRIDNDREIDLVIERTGEPTFLCEIKSTSTVDERHCKHLESLGKDFRKSIQLLISLDPVPKKIGSTTALPWPAAIQAILSSSGL